ncbi:hypothetical protein ACLIX5_004471 [Salmonella enterica subsp. enterica serovar Bredeney]
MPAPNRKQRKATEKHIDRLTALFIKTHPGILKQFTKEVIRNLVIDGELTLAFKRLEAKENGIS